MATDAKDLELTTWLAFDWKANPVMAATFQAAIRQVEDTLTDALLQARRNVAPGKGPGPHPHRTDHGFAWEDQGLLQKAIRIERSYTLTKNGKYTGAPHGRLVVEPVALTDPETGETRTINYGAALELGFRPVLTRKKKGGGYEQVRGHLTRYPFLSPAMYMATARFASRLGLRMTRELADMSRRSRKERAVLERAPITPDALRRIQKGVQIVSTVQHVDDLDELAALRTP